MARVLLVGFPRSTGSRRTPQTARKSRGPQYPQTRQCQPAFLPSEPRCGQPDGWPAANVSFRTGIRCALPELDAIFADYRTGHTTNASDPSNDAPQMNSYLILCKTTDQILVNVRSWPRRHA